MKIYLFSQIDSNLNALDRKTELHSRNKKRNITIFIIFFYIFLSSVLGIVNTVIVYAQNGFYLLVYEISVFDFYVGLKIARKFEWKEQILGLPRNDNLYHFVFWMFESKNRRRDFLFGFYYQRIVYVNFKLQFLILPQPAWFLWYHTTLHEPLSLLYIWNSQLPFDVLHCDIGVWIISSSHSLWMVRSMSIWKWTHRWNQISFCFHFTVNVFGYFQPNVDQNENTIQRFMDIYDDLKTVLQCEERYSSYLIIDCFIAYNRFLFQWKWILYNRSSFIEFISCHKCHS